MCCDTPLLVLSHEQAYLFRFSILDRADSSRADTYELAQVHLGYPPLMSVSAVN